MMGQVLAEAQSDERVQFALDSDSPEERALAASVPAVTGLAPRRARAAALGLRAWAYRQSAALADAWELEQSRGIEFLLATLCFGAGALIYFVMRAEPGWVGLLGAACLLIAAIRLARNRFNLKRLFIAMLVLLLGMMAGKIETWRHGTQMLGAPISTAMTGRVVAVEYQASGRVRLTLDVLSTARPQLRYAPERIRATARAVPDGLGPGDTVRGLVRLMTPSGPVRPGSYDFAFESYFDGLGAIGFFMRNPERLETEAGWSSWQAAAAVERLRSAMAQRIRSVIGGAEGEIAAALIAGVRAGIPEPVNEDLRITGLAHILSISGLHMALVAGVVMGGMRVGFSLFPSFAARHPVKKYAAGIAIAALAFYLLLSGNQVAAARSFLMLAIMLLAVMLDRAALSMRNLAISAFIILAITPHEIMGPSFQMSFAATAALVAGYAAWAENRRQRVSAQPERQGMITLWLRRGLYALLGLAATSVLAGVATAVFGAYHFQRVSPLSLFANLATMPLVSIIVMPFAVIATLLMPFGLDAPALHVMGEGLTWILWIANWIARHSPVDAVGRIPVPALLSLTLALLLATITTTRLRVLAVPLALAGFLAFLPRDLPEILISEDGRLVGLMEPDGQLAVNRERPNAFTLQDWQRASGGITVLKPQEKEDATTDALLAAARTGSDGFVCNADACAARHPMGAIVAWVASAAEAVRFCNHAAIILVDDATAESPCSKSESRVVTKRDLAQKGSAEIHLAGHSPYDAAIIHAIRTPYRPWHEHRRFSREARGLPPYRRKERPAKPAAPKTDQENKTTDPSEKQKTSHSNPPPA